MRIESSVVGFTVFYRSEFDIFIFFCTHIYKMDICDQILTFDDFLSWKIEALREFLGKRGLAKDKPKRELAALAYSAHTMKLPVLPSAKEQEEVRCKDYQSLLVFDGTTIPDPFSLHERWVNEQDGMKLWPPIYLTDIVQYAGVSDSNVSMSKFLQEYKLGKGQSFVEAKHVGEIFYHPITSKSCVCLLRAECIPSQHIRDDPHKIWICVEKESGVIKSSYCTCTAGLGTPCIHVTATLFRIETAHRTGASTCTSLPCSWTIPSLNSSRAVPSRLKDLKVTKPNHSLKNGQKRKLVSDEKENFEPLQQTKDTFLELTTALRDSLPNACIFKGIDIPEEHYTKPEEKMPTDLEEFSMQHMIANGLEGPLSVPLIKETVESLNTATVGQHKNEQWHILRKGRITSSNFYSVSCKIKHNRSQNVVRPLLSNIMGYTSVNPNVKALKHGREMEPIASESYQLCMKKGHTNVVFSNCGIFIDSCRPYLAASPDLIVSCSCCGDGVAEFKCPMIPKCDICTDFCLCKLPVFLHYEDGLLSLNRNHAYFAQIQGQMAISGRFWCDFYVYTCNGNFLERVEFNKEYYYNLQCDLDSYFNLYILPEFKSRNVENSFLKDEPMDVDVVQNVKDGNVFFCPICKGIILDDVKTYKAQSVQCDKCHLWYHFSCVHVTKTVLKDKKEWFCSHC